MTLQEANNLLRNMGKRRPVSAQPQATLTAKPNVVVLKTRITQASKAVGVALESAKRIGNTRLIMQTRALSEQLAKLEADLNKI